MLSSGPPCCPNGVKGFGNLDADVLLLGIAPGRDEWTRSKQPFSGPSGKLLDAVLEAVGYSRAECYATNLICWWNDNPTTADILRCAPRLNKELQRVAPKVVVPLGKLATETFLPGMLFGRCRGAVIDRNGTKVLPTYHPAAALHVDRTEPEQSINAAFDLIRDLKKVPDLLAREHEWPLITYTLIDDPAKAQSFLDRLPKDRVVTIDVETNWDKEHAKNSPFDHNIICAAISYDDSHAYVLTRKVLNSGLVWPTDVRWGFHHGQFDTIEIRREFGFWLPIVEDSMLGSYSLDERGGYHRLKPRSREYTGADFYEVDVHKNEETPETYGYNAKDAVHTWRNIDIIRPEQEQEGVRPLYTNILIPAANMAARSQFRGIHADLVAAQQLKMELALELMDKGEELQAIAKEYGWPGDINLNSPMQLSLFLFGSQFLGLPIIGRTPAGTPSTDKMTLQELDHPFVNGLEEYRLIYRTANNYLVKSLAQVKYDGRFHPQPNIHGTTSGRWSYNKPAIQTLPKEGTAGVLSRVRRIFSSTSDDYILVEFDYERMEGWMGAFLSEDDMLFEDLASGDWHGKTAEAFLGYQESEVSSDKWAYARRAAKAVNYGTMYGETAHGLTRKPPLGIGCTMQEGQYYLNQWYGRYAKFAQWQRDLLKRAYANGELVSRTGRKRRCPLRVNPHQDRQLLNWEIQSTCHEFTVLSAIELWQELEQLDSYLLFLEHDALYWEVSRQHFDEVCSMVRQTMEKPRFGLPGFKTEAKAGPNLYDMELVRNG